MRPATERIATITEALHAVRFRISNEADLQRGVEQVLKSHNETFEREVVLGPTDRIDFLLADGIGLELKVKGSGSAVIRQLQRYAYVERIRGLLLVTTRMLHRRAEGEMNGKPVRVHTIMSGLL